MVDDNVDVINIEYYSVAVFPADERASYGLVNSLQTGPRARRHDDGMGGI
jgi:hypothetical protein